MASDQQEIRSERGVTQYQHLTSLLKHRIAKGKYPLGALLPPITQLADDLNVAVVTIRQAYELLSGEGLIHSQHDVETHVTALPTNVDDLELAINDPFATPQTLTFEILEVRHRAAVPQKLLRTGDRPADENIYVRKLHTYSSEPFCYAEIYVPTLIFEALPKDTTKKRKLLAAMLDELSPRCRQMRQHMTVAPTNFPLYDMLKIPFASPIAKMSRHLINAKSNVLYVGVT